MIIIVQNISPAGRGTGLSGQRTERKSRHVQATEHVPDPAWHRGGRVVGIIALAWP